LTINKRLFYLDNSGVAVLVLVLTIEVDIMGSELLHIGLGLFV